MNDEFAKNLENAFDNCSGSSAYSMERDRPYDGQAHTSDGLRGAVKVEGLTFRDIKDCMIRGFLDAAGVQRENPVENDVYCKEMDDIDPLAAINNMSCHIEKMMGIYPNVPKVSGDEDEEES